MTSNLDPDARSSYRLITLAARLIQRRQDDALAHLGLTRAAVIALEGLTGGPLNQEQLAEEIRVQSQTLGRVLTRLEAGRTDYADPSSLGPPAAESGVDGVRHRCSRSRPAGGGQRLPAWLRYFLEGPPGGAHQVHPRRAARP